MTVLEALRGVAAVLDTVEAERKALRAELKLLDSMAVKLGGDAPEQMAPTPTPAPAKPKPKSPKSKQSGGGTTSPAAALERRDAVLRFITEAQGETVAAGEIERGLGISGPMVRTALRRLEEDVTNELDLQGSGRGAFLLRTLNRVLVTEAVG